MGFRFRKRLRIFPGLWLNASKSGLSAAVGRRGATVNLSSKGHQETVGLPGSGVSYRTRRRKFGKPGGPASAPRSSVTAEHLVYLIAIAGMVCWILAHGH